MDKAPDAFRTISEVADDLDIPQHVLRFWESRFTQIKPMKRGGGRRYYRPDDVALLRGIRHLLYGQGYTIRGVQRILREQGIGFVQTVWEEGAAQPEPADEDEAATDRTEASEPEASTPTASSERREPTFATSAPTGPANRMPRANISPQPPSLSSGPAPSTAPSPARGGLDKVDRQGLRDALDELVECRRLLDAALEQQA